MNAGFNTYQPNTLAERPEDKETTHRKDDSKMVPTKRMDPNLHENVNVRKFIKDKQQTFVKKVLQHNLSNLVVGEEVGAEFEDQDAETNVVD